MLAIRIDDRVRETSFRHCGAQCSEPALKLSD